MGLDTCGLLADLQKIKDIPILLETPSDGNDDIHGDEIKLLEWLSGRQVTDEEYLEKRDSLSKAGSKERQEQAKKFEKKQLKVPAKRNGLDIGLMLTKKTKAAKIEPKEEK